ncbi:hypothetical protein C5706_33020, partial [Klebsiella pneumoniae]
ADRKSGATILPPSFAPGRPFNQWLSGFFKRDVRFSDFATQAEPTGSLGQPFYRPHSRPAGRLTSGSAAFSSAMS